MNKSDNPAAPAENDPCPDPVRWAAEESLAGKAELDARFEEWKARRTPLSKRLCEGLTEYVRRGHEARRRAERARERAGAGKGGAAAAPERRSGGRRRRRSKDEMDRLAGEALSLLCNHPEWSQSQIAETLKISRSYLQVLRGFQGAWKRERKGAKTGMLRRHSVRDEHGRFQPRV